MLPSAFHVHTHKHIQKESLCLVKCWKGAGINTRHSAQNAKQNHKKDVALPGHCEGQLRLGQWENIRQQHLGLDAAFRHQGVKRAAMVSVFPVRSQRNTQYPSLSLHRS